jgi:dihydroorotase
MKTLIVDAQIVNEGRTISGNLLIDGKYIEAILPNTSFPRIGKEIIADGQYLLPGCIDDQVHFREPGLTHKGEILTESRAAIAGGITSFMEMPNTVPNALTQQLLQDKYDIAAKRSMANYSFFMGVSNDNAQEVLKTNKRDVCGVKIFMGSSTGNMLVDNAETLEHIFANCELLIATHCEDEATIKHNLMLAKEKYGDNIPVQMHPVIRDVEACYKSSSFAVEMAKKHGTKLHVLHISTEKELSLFRNDIPLSEKRITAEACIHHLWFSEEDYATKGNFIKWNPAVKASTDRDAIFNAVLDGRIDVIATDHAPHTLEEKSNAYSQAPSGGPLVQHALLAMLDKFHQQKISIEKIVDLMSHHVASLFQIENRGFIREGYFADLVLVDLKSPTTVNRQNVLAKCGWSPFEGHTFQSSVKSTFVNGNLVFHHGKFNETYRGERLLFNR